MGQPNSTQVAPELAMQQVLDVWDEYQRTHEAETYRHMSVGVHPDTGRVFVAESMKLASEAANAAGLSGPLVWVRIGRIDGILQRKRLGGRWRRVT